MAEAAPFSIRPAQPRDVAAIVGLIAQLAAFEKLSHLLRVTPETLAPHLFGDKPVVEAIVAERPGAEGAKGNAGPPHLSLLPLGGADAARRRPWGHTRVVAFALYFTNFSTFLGKPGLYLEDLFVEPAARGDGIGEALLRELGRIAVARDYGRFEWSVLDWNANAIRFYERMGATVMPDWRICRITGDKLAALG